MDPPLPGRVIRLAELKPRIGLPGHPGLTAYSFARPGQGCRWLLVTLDVVAEGGGIEPHYHEGRDFDHAYYVVAGELLVTIGEQEYRVGPDSLVIFPAGVVHGFKAVSPGGARVLRLEASPTGEVTGGSVFVGTDRVSGGG